MRFKELIAKIIIAPVAISHELCHYTVARLLGVEAELHLTYVTYARKSRDLSWKMVVISAAPIVAGFAIQTFVTGLSYSRGDYTPALLGLVFNAAWQYMCLYDYQRIWRFFYGGG